MSVHVRAIFIGALSLQTLFAWLVLAGLGAPLLWHDEADTAMYGRHVLEYGYPKVHDPRNIVYGVQHPLELGVHEPLDAYLGSPWGQYYFAAPAVAWSDASHDLGERTRRVRLPFAIAGWLGVLLLGVAGTSLWPAGARERKPSGAQRGAAERRSDGRAFLWLGFGACLVISVSLQLHLREARYYPLVLLGLGAIGWFEMRYHARGDLASLPHALLLAGVLFWLFNLFYPAFAAVTATAGVALGWQALRSKATMSARWRELASAAAPYALAGLAVLPLVAFYRIPAQSRAFLDFYGGSPQVWADRLLDALHYLIRFELLGPAAIGAAALGLARRRARRAGRGLTVQATAHAPLRAPLFACDLVLVFVALWILLVARTPFFYERYYVALSPLLGGCCVLQAGCLVALRRAGAPRIATAGCLALAASCLGSVALRAPELRGRLAELREPYRGPLDHVIPYLASRYAAPEELVIATNYEEFSYMFYLGATTTCGFYAPDLARDLALQPDVIVPRPWPWHQQALEQLAGREAYARHELPVANLRINNLPSLSYRNQSHVVHRFVSPGADEGEGPLVVLERTEPRPPRVVGLAGRG